MLPCRVYRGLRPPVSMGCPLNSTVFWTVLKEDMLGVFSESFEDSSLPQSCRRAVLTLLPKKGVLQEIKKWRPVSLLCVDYKLVSKVLSNQLKNECITH